MTSNDRRVFVENSRSCQQVSKSGHERPERLPRAIANEKDRVFRRPLRHERTVLVRIDVNSPFRIRLERQPNLLDRISLPWDFRHGMFSTVPQLSLGREAREDVTTVT